MEHVTNTLDLSRLCVQMRETIEIYRDMSLSVV